MSITQSTTDELILEQHDRVLLIKLNRPDRLNAISRNMLDELSAKVVAADKDPEVRCIVLTGEGKGFCAGLDLIDTNKRREDEQDQESSSEHNRPPRKLFDLRDAPINVMWHCDTPIICAVNGYAKHPIKVFVFIHHAKRTYPSISLVLPSLYTDIKSAYPYT